MATARTIARASAPPSRRQVIDRIMTFFEIYPQAVTDLPATLKTRSHWEKTLSPKNPNSVAVLTVLQQLPIFTNQRPTSDTPAAWARALADYGPEQMDPTLRHVNSAATVVEVKRPVVRYWRDAFGKDEVVQRVRPTESDAYLHNPHRGTTTFQRFQGDDLCPTLAWNDRCGPTRFPVKKIRDNVKFIPRTTLTYCRWPWAWLEPEKGSYNWDIIDGTLKTARDRGQSAQLRFQPYTIPVNTAKHPPKARRYPPETSVDVPDWYWDTGAAWIENGAFAKNEPDSNDPRYLEHFGNFIRAFAQRYDGHPDIESIDIAYAGFWGEAGGNCTPRTAAKLAQIYIDRFRRTQLVGMLGTPGFTHALREAGKDARHIGWRADSFGDFHRANVVEVPAGGGWNHMYDAYVQEIHDSSAQEAWKTAPVTMETSATVAHWEMDRLDIDQILYEGLLYHTSVFMPKSGFFPEKVLPKLVDFDKRIGYRFTLRHLLFPIEATPGGTIAVDVFLDNVGCAPIYRPYRLALRLKQGRRGQVLPFTCDIRNWLPGHNFARERLTFPLGFERGEVTVALGIVDGTDTPRVAFAIEGPVD
nr:DUF4832 domain-containing protein [Planctomycetota bacterium]